MSTSIFIPSYSVVVGPLIFAFALLTRSSLPISVIVFPCPSRESLLIQCDMIISSNQCLNTSKSL